MWDIVFISQLLFLLVFAAANEQLNKTQNRIHELEQDIVHSAASSVTLPSIYMELSNDTETPGKSSVNVQTRLPKTQVGARSRSLLKQLPKAKLAVEEKSTGNNGQRAPVHPPGEPTVAANSDEKPVGIYTEKKEKLSTLEKPAQGAHDNATFKAMNFAKQKTAAEKLVAAQPRLRPSSISALPKGTFTGKQSISEKHLTAEKTAFSTVPVRARLKAPNMEQKAVSEIAKPSLTGTPPQASVVPSTERTKTSAQAVVPKPELIMKPLLRTIAKEPSAVAKPISREPAVFKELLNVKPPPKFQAKAVSAAKQAARSDQNVIHPMAARPANEEAAESQLEKKPEGLREKPTITVRPASKGALPVAQHIAERPTLAHRRPSPIARLAAETFKVETRGKTETLTANTAQRQAAVASKLNVIERRPYPAARVSVKPLASPPERKLVSHDIRATAAEKPPALSLHRRIAPSSNRTIAVERIMPPTVERKVRPHENRAPLTERPVHNTLQNKPNFPVSPAIVAEKPVAISNEKIRNGVEAHHRASFKPSAATAPKANATVTENVAPMAKRLIPANKSALLNNSHPMQTNKVDGTNSGTLGDEKAEVVIIKVAEQSNPTTFTESKVGGSPPMPHIHTLPPGIEPPLGREAHI